MNNRIRRQLGFILKYAEPNIREAVESIIWIVYGYIVSDRSKAKPILRRVK